jgi:hypothetical protein
MALSKLGNFLFGVIRSLPWDCTFDQEKGLVFTLEALKRGKKVYCFDLSDATNYFPLELQEYVVSFCGHPDIDTSMRLFRHLARARWSTPNSYDIMDFEAEFLQCSKGQPLGLYPSFPLFALTHGLLLRALEYEFGLKDTFRVLGDDVVITSGSVASRYTEVMEKTRSADLIN